MKKLKEIKEKEDEDTSLLEEIKFKSQAAMEYLMTYGWAILIIALSLVVLYSLGIMNPKNFIPRAPPGSCFVFRPNGPGTTDFISLQGTCGYLPMYVASFNGVDGNVKINDNDNLDTRDYFTIIGWYNFISIRSGDNYFYNRNSQTGTSGFHIIYILGSSSPIYYQYANGSTFKVLGSNTLSWSTGRWYFIAITHDNVVKTVKFYRDSVNVGIATYTDNALNVVSGNAYLGGYQGDNRFNGLIANVQIYNTALTPQEIQYLYQQGLGGGPIRLGSLVGWWPLNGDAKDYSGNNNHGTINGGVTFVQNYNPP